MEALLTIAASLASDRAPVDEPLPDPLHLDTVLELARTRRPELRASRARARAALEQPAIVSALEDPTLSPARAAEADARRFRVLIENAHKKIAAAERDGTAHDRRAIVIEAAQALVTIHPVTVPGISIAEAKRLLAWQDAQWREGLTLEAMIAELDAKTKLPGMQGAWTMPIKARVDMLSTGTALALLVVPAVYVVWRTSHLRSRSLGRVHATRLRLFFACALLPLVKIKKVAGVEPPFELEKSEITVAGEDLQALIEAIGPDQPATPFPLIRDSDPSRSWRFADPAAARSLLERMGS